MLNKAGERSEPRKFGIFNHQIWKNSEIRTLFLFWTDLGGGGGERPLHPLSSWLAEQEDWGSIPRLAT